MIWDIKAPCKSCPYRKDAPLKLWHRSEFENLLAHDVDHDHADGQLGTIFGCHEYGKRPPAVQRPCGGWLLDQKKRGVPSIILRIALSRSEAAVACMNEITGKGLKLFRSVAAMCRANGVEPK